MPLAPCSFYHILHKLLRLAAGGTIADGDSLNLVFLQHVLQVHGGLHAVVDWRVGEDGLVVQQVALGIEAYHLASCAEAWVDTHDTLLTQRG